MKSFEGRCCKMTSPKRSQSSSPVQPYTMSGTPYCQKFFPKPCGSSVVRREEKTRRFSHSSFPLLGHTAWRVWPGKLVSLPGEGRGVSARLQLPFPAWRELAGVETRISGGRSQARGGVPAGIPFSSRASFHLPFPERRS